MKLWKNTSVTGLTAVFLLTAVTPAAAMSPVPPQVNVMPVKVKATDGVIKPSEQTEAPVDTKITKEKAIELARSYVKIPEGFEIQHVSFQNYAYRINNSKGVWNLSFNKENKQQRYFGNINVTLDSESGKLLSYHINNNDPSKKPTYPPKVDLNQAKQIGLDYIVSLNPEQKNQLVYSDMYEPKFRPSLNPYTEYHLRYERSVNGIPYSNDYISATVNGDGEIIAYQSQWNENLTFDQVSEPISKEKAAELVKTHAQPSLQYIFPYQVYGNQIQPQLAYQMEPFMLDAQSGEVLNEFTTKGYQKDLTPLTDKPLANKQTESLNLTKEQASEKVASLLPLPQNVKLEEASYRENYENKYEPSGAFWELRWKDEETKEEEMHERIWATVNSKTGDILRFSKHDKRIYLQGNTVSENESVNLDDLKQKAIESVKKLVPSYTHQLYLRSEPKDIPADKIKYSPTYHFSFGRVINGIATEHDSVNITFDRKTGEMIDFYSSFREAQYPTDKPNVITEDKAVDTLLSLYNIELRYILDVKGNPSFPYYGMPIPYEKYNVLVAAGEINPNAPKEEPKTRLVYTLTPKVMPREPYYLDAVTGQWKNRENGELINLITEKPTDLEGHWAKKELELMLDYQALDVVEGKINPDQFITRGEMIKMLLLSLNGGYFPMKSNIMYAERAASFDDVSKDSPYFAYVENAIDQNLIDRDSSEFQPHAKLSKDELAALIVRALGFRKLAQIDGIFNITAQDIEEVNNKGNIAIVTGLDILRLEDGQFHPEQEITRAHAAAAFYRFLQARALLQDFPMY